MEKNDKNRCPECGETDTDMDIIRGNYYDPKTNTYHDVGLRVYTCPKCGNLWREPLAHDND